MEIVFIFIAFVGLFGLPFWINLYGRLKGNKPASTEAKVEEPADKR